MANSVMMFERGGTRHNAPIGKQQISIASGRKRRKGGSCPQPRKPCADCFAGTAKLRELHEVAGRAVTNFGGIEDTLRYLDWQLKAFVVADPLLRKGLSSSDTQRTLDAERATYFGTHMVVRRVLRGIDTGFRSAPVKRALGTEACAGAGRGASEPQIQANTPSPSLPLKGGGRRLRAGTKSHRDE